MQKSCSLNRQLVAILELYYIIIIIIHHQKVGGLDAQKFFIQKSDPLFCFSHENQHFHFNTFTAST